MDLNRDNPGTASEIASRALRHRRELQADRASVLGLLLNKVPLAAHADIVSGVAAELADSGLTFAGGIPYDRIIGTARLGGRQYVRRTAGGWGDLHAVLAQQQGEALYFG